MFCFNLTFIVFLLLYYHRHVSLEVSVMDYDRFGKDEAIGKNCHYFFFILFSLLFVVIKIMMEKKNNNN